MSGLRQGSAVKLLSRHLERSYASKHSSKWLSRKKNTSGGKGEPAAESPGPQSQQKDAPLSPARTGVLLIGGGIYYYGRPGEPMGYPDPKRKPHNKQLASLTSHRLPERSFRVHWPMWMRLCSR
ncbi:hypothetical protein WJX73_007746 [Symbiochloris irregularis]|uniref:Uncharacterized protein n=1 Tax=Symbiochloris irregularis TaxID=706552 RepID=A0AAW1NL30_9CHLO